MSDRNTRWDSLQDAWREPAGDAPSAPDIGSLRRQARGERVRLWALAVCELGVAAAFLAYLTRLVVADPRPSFVVAAATTYLFAAVAFSFSLWNRRGLWTATADSTRGFVELARRRCLRKLRTVSFVWGLLAAEAFFLAAWIPWQVRTSPTLSAAGAEPYWRGYGLLALIVVAYSVFLVWYGRRTRRELDELEGWLAD